MIDILKKTKDEIMLLFFSVCLGIPLYLAVAIILNIFDNGPTYDHWLPLSVGIITSLAIWLNTQIGKRL